MRGGYSHCSLAPVLRGEGRGEGEPRSEVAFVCEVGVPSAQALSLTLSPAYRGEGTISPFTASRSSR
jgi:hypothetical protein